jgi:hypothetical protein
MKCEICGTGDATHERNHRLAPAAHWTQALMCKFVCAGCMALYFAYFAVAACFDPMSATRRQPSQRTAAQGAPARGSISSGPGSAGNAAMEAAQARATEHEREIAAVSKAMDALNKERQSESGPLGGFNKQYMVKLGLQQRKLAFLQKDPANMMENFVDFTSSGETIDMTPQLMLAAAKDTARALAPIGGGVAAAAGAEAGAGVEAAAAAAVGGAMQPDPAGPGQPVARMLAGNIFKTEKVPEVTAQWVNGHVKSSAGKLNEDGVNATKLRWEAPQPNGMYRPCAHEFAIGAGTVWRPEKQFFNLTKWKSLPCPVHGFCSEVTGHGWADVVPVVTRGLDEWMLRSRAICSLCGSDRDRAQSTYTTSKEKLALHARWTRAMRIDDAGEGGGAGETARGDRSRHYQTAIPPPPPFRHS